MQSVPNQQGWETLENPQTLAPLPTHRAVVHSVPAEHCWKGRPRHLPVAVEQAPLAQSALEVHAPPGLRPHVPPAEHTLFDPQTIPAGANCPVVADTSLQVSVPLVQKPTPA